MEKAKRGGVLLRIDGDLRLVSAAVAVRVAPPPRVTAVPGGPRELLGIAVHDGAIIPVVSIGAVRGQMVVCHHAGELVGLVGGEVVETGSFDVAPERPEMIEYQGRLAPMLDLSAICARIHSPVRRSG
jgi:chemotaxis signal transduction protein